MRPIALKGHEKPITVVKYNKDGDLLFSASKDYKSCLWMSENGERMGTYDGHKGVVWCLDVSWDSSKVMTGGGDNDCIIFDCSTGKDIMRVQAATAVRTCGFSYSGNLVFYTTDQRRNAGCELKIYDIRDGSSFSSKDDRPLKIIAAPKSKITSAVWSHMDHMIVTGHENGDICQYDHTVDTNDPVDFVSDQGKHKGAVMDLQMSQDEMMILSASKDRTAKLFDSTTLELMKTYKSERPVNSAALSPTDDVLILGGGEEAMTVTQTSAAAGQFEAKLYHLIFEEEWGRIKGHFGPINSIGYSPDGKQYSSGSEDGYVRIHNFDKDYFEFDFDY